MDYKKIAYRFFASAGVEFFSLAVTIPVPLQIIPEKSLPKKPSPFRRLMSPSPLVMVKQR